MTNILRKNDNSNVVCRTKKKATIVRGTDDDDVGITVVSLRSAVDATVRYDEKNEKRKID